MTKYISNTIRRLEIEQLKLVIERTEAAIANAKLAIKAMSKKQLRRRKELIRLTQ